MTTKPPLLFKDELQFLLSNYKADVELIGGKINILDLLVHDEYLYFPHPILKGEKLKIFFADIQSLILFDKDIHMRLYGLPATLIIPLGSTNAPDELMDELHKHLSESVARFSSESCVEYKTVKVYTIS